MNLTKASMKDLQGDVKTQDLIEEFLSTGYKCAKVEFSSNEYPTAASLCAAVRRWARAMEAPVTASRRSGDVYLVNTEVEE